MLYDGFNFIVMEEELDELNYFIKILDSEIQENLLKNEFFEDTKEGKKLIKEINSYLSLRDKIEDKISLNQSF